MEKSLSGQYSVFSTSLRTEILFWVTLTKSKSFGPSMLYWVLREETIFARTLDSPSSSFSTTIPLSTIISFFRVSTSSSSSLSSEFALRRANSNGFFSRFLDFLSFLFFVAVDVVATLNCSFLFSRDCTVHYWSLFASWILPEPGFWRWNLHLSFYPKHLNLNYSRHSTTYQMPL